MAKQFFVEYESDRKCCGSNRHHAGNASTIKSAKTIIAHTRRDFAKERPRNFKVFNCYADVDPATNFVPCVYSED